MAKIAFLSYYSGVVERGVENFVFELTKRLKQKHEVTIFQAGERIQNPQIRTYQIKALAQPPKSSKSLISKTYLDWQSFKILIFTLKALPKIIQGRFQIIIPLNGGWQTLIMRIISKFMGAKIIVSGHAGVGLDDAFNILYRPDVFVALTSDELEWAKKITPEVKMVKIPNGVDLAHFNP